MPPPSQVKIQGSHGSSTERAQTRPAFSESSVSARLGALGARLEVLVCKGAERVAVLSSIPPSDAVVRNSHGLAGIESTFALQCTRVEPGSTLVGDELLFLCSTNDVSSLCAKVCRCC